MSAGAGIAEAEKPIVVAGCPRSGTTLLRLILDSHPHIACGPESKVLWYLATAGKQHWEAHSPELKQRLNLDAEALARSYGDLAAELLTPYARQHGKRRLAEKSPENADVLGVLAFMLPASPVVHIIRDGRDVVASLLRQNWHERGTGEPAPFTRDAGAAAQRWCESVTRARICRTQFPERYFELSYEDLVAAPEATLRPLFAHLDEPWDPAVLEPHRQRHDLSHGDRVSHGDTLNQPIYRGAQRRWERDLTAEQCAAVKAKAGELLIELGYAADKNW